MIILRSNIDLFANIILCSSLQQIATVDLFFIDNTIRSGLQQIATVDLFFIDNTIRSGLQQIAAVDLFINIMLYSGADLFNNNDLCSTQ